MAGSFQFAMLIYQRVMIINNNKYIYIIIIMIIMVTIIGMGNWNIRWPSASSLHTPSPGASHTPPGWDRWKSHRHETPWEDGGLLNILSFCLKSWLFEWKSWVLCEHVFGKIMIFVKFSNIFLLLRSFKSLVGKKLVACSTHCLPLSLADGPRVVVHCFRC